MTPKNKLDIRSEEFWDEEALLKEERRQLDVCHGCRLCWNFCPVFPSLFELTDAVEEGQKPQLTRRDLRIVEDQCYQCKLCYIRCPYTAPHELDLDVPRLLMRAKMVNRRKEGVPWNERLLADTDRTGKMGGLTAPLANSGNTLAPVRFVLEKAMGIHPKANLPKFHSRTFESWFQANKDRLNRAAASDAPKAALFYTCSVNYNDPPVGIAAAEVLSHNGVRIEAPGQQCCGLPFLDAGALDSALAKFNANIGSLSRMVRDGYDIVVLSPSCSLTIKQEYPRLVETEEAKLVAERTFDISEYLWQMKVGRRLDTAFKSTGFLSGVKSIAYHVPCHIRAQFAGNKGAMLMELLPDMEVTQIERCSAHDGTWGVKKESFDLSMEYGRKLFRAMKEEEADLFVSDCPLASNHIELGTGTRPIHPVQVLKEAYGITP